MQCNLMNSFFDLLCSVERIQKKPKEYNGYLLYHSEINLIEAISHNPNSNLSKLSEILKITKGAITQLNSKLLQKKLVEQYTLRRNKKEKYFRLTKEGISVKEKHQEYHKESNSRLCNYMRSLSEEESRTIFTFMDTLKTCIPVCTFSCEWNEENNNRRCIK